MPFSIGVRPSTLWITNKPLMAKSHQELPIHHVNGLTTIEVGILINIAIINTCAFIVSIAFLHSNLVVKFAMT